MKKVLSCLALILSFCVLVSCQHSHSAKTEWSNDETNHWHQCDGCEEKLESEAHTYGDWTTVTEATESAKGSKERVCSVCSYKEEAEIPMLDHTHKHATTYTTDANSHWYECACGDKKDVANHTYGEWTVVTEATESAKGSKERVCSTCSYKETAEIPQLTKINVTGTVSNVFDGSLENVNVTLNNQVVSTNANGEWTVANYLPSNSNVLLVEKAGYDTVEMVLSNDDLSKAVNIDMAKEYKKVGQLVSKTWANYEAFNTKVSRNKDGMLVRLHSDNVVFTSEGRNSWVELYFSVGTNMGGRDGNDGVTKVTIYSNKTANIANMGGKAVAENGFVVNVNDSNGTTTIDVFVSYGNLYMNNNEIIGVTCGLWSEVDKDWAPMTSLDSTNLSAVETPSQYVRCDKENSCFISSVNDYPAEVPTPDYDKAELIKNYKYGFADPVKVKFDTADDVYLNVNKTSTGFVFDMIGFGTLEANEYFKLVLHTSETDAGGWGLQPSDITFLVSSTNATKKSGLTDFWAYTAMAANDPTANHMPVFNVTEAGYFTMQFTVDFTEIPEYAQDKEVSFLIVEFGSVIYNNDPWINAMTVNGVGVGDPAAQSSYQVIQEKPTTVDKEALLASYNLKFSTNYYAKVERLDYSLKVSVISFTAMDEDDFIRFIVDVDGVAATHRPDWPIDANDVSFSIYKNISYVQTGQTWFWDGEGSQFHIGNHETLYTPEYTNHGEYWTLTLEIDYSELGGNITKESNMKGLLVFFNPGIQNNGFEFNGVVPGDVALQTNYFAF